MLLSDKVCIITGAASARGIGRATARLFAQHGAKVVILDLDEAQARDAAADLGQGHLGLACNVTDTGRPASRPPSARLVNTAALTCSSTTPASPSRSSSWTSSLRTMTRCWT